jgi:hypothetical protein
MLLRNMTNCINEKNKSLVMKYLINRRVNIFEDEDENTYKVVDYLLFDHYDDDYDPSYVPEGEVIGMLFQFTIKEDDNSILEDNEIELEFLDPYEEDFYGLNELESVFLNDVSEFGDKLSTVIDIKKVKEAISKHKGS